MLVGHTAAKASFHNRSEKPRSHAWPRLAGSDCLLATGPHHTARRSAPCRFVCSAQRRTSIPAHTHDRARVSPCSGVHSSAPYPRVPARATTGPSTAEVAGSVSEWVRRGAAPHAEAASGGSAAGRTESLDMTCGARRRGDHAADVRAVKGG